MKRRTKESPTTEDDTRWVKKKNGPFQFTFNGLLKVAFQGSHVTSDAGLILVRELDERMGLEALIADHLSDSRHGTNTQFRVADLLRQSVYSRLAGYEDLNDAHSIKKILRIWRRNRSAKFHDLPHATNSDLCLKS